MATINPNLAALSKLSSNNPNSTRDGFTWHIVKTGGTDGLIFDVSELTVGETYTFSFKCQKTSGTLQVIGGHSEAFSLRKFTIDDIEQTETYIQGAPIADDSEVHEVVYTGVFNGNGSNKNLYFQPNRKLGIAVSCYVWDVKMEVGSEATAWIPAAGDGFTITYQTKRGAAPAGKAVEARESYTLMAADLPDLSVDGYTFGGWSINGIVVFAGYEISADTVLVAVWLEDLPALQIDPTSMLMGWLVGRQIAAQRGKEKDNE